MTRPTAKQIKAIADVAGVPVSNEVAERIGNSIGPALEGFAAVAALAKGNKRGVLHGVPLAHKDMYYEAGKVVTCGSKIRRDFVATTTSSALRRLKDAGTIRLGSLQMAEFAYGPTGHNSHYGPVHNPWAIDHITGGSSSGSGSAGAGRLTFAA